MDEGYGTPVAFDKRRIISANEIISAGAFMCLSQYRGSKGLWGLNAPEIRSIDGTDHPVLLGSLKGFVHRNTHDRSVVPIKRLERAPDEIFCDEGTRAVVDHNGLSGYLV